MKNEFFKFSSRRILFSTVMASALLAGSPQAVFAEVNELQSVMQAGTVKGQVVDAAGEPVIGATVQVKGTTNGTITDFDGNFILNNVPEKGILVISYIGYKAQEVNISGKTSIKVVVKEDTEVLDEVVVVAGALSPVKESKIPLNNNLTCIVHFTGKEGWWYTYQCYYGLLQDALMKIFPIVRREVSRWLSNMFITRTILVPIASTLTYSK